MTPCAACGLRRADCTGYGKRLCAPCLGLAAAAHKSERCCTELRVVADRMACERMGVRIPEVEPPGCVYCGVAVSHTPRVCPLCSALRASVLLVTHGVRDWLDACVAVQTAILTAHGR